MREHKKGTLLGNIYFERYWVKNDWINNPLEVVDPEEYGRKVVLFRKYGKEYGFDHMLLMAVAYHESGLDNACVNDSGAVGIMQVMPSTACDPSVGIDDVTGIDNNIRAGAKYLAFLRDTYFSDEGLLESERVRFTLAAYNAGPGRVIEARRLADEMGLDGDVWFRNVEFAMLRLVGRQPVEYVSNINKYYIIFSMQDYSSGVRDTEKANGVSK
jgi:membrane-bound lytic murein transglycosylase MltF